MPILFFFTPARGKTSPEDIDRIVRVAEIHSGLSFLTLERSLKSRALKMRQDAKYLKAFLQQHGAYAAEAIAISNALSQQAVRWVFHQHPARKKIFVYLGRAHLPILETKDVDAEQAVSPEELAAIIGQRDHHALVLALEAAKVDVEKLINSALPNIESLARYVFESEIRMKNYKDSFFYRVLQSLAIIKSGLDQKKPPDAISAEAGSVLGFSTTPDVVDAAYHELERYLMTLSAHADILVQMVASKLRGR